MKVKEYVRNYNISTRSVERRATILKDGKRNFKIYMPDKSYFTDLISDLLQEFINQIITLNPKGIYYGQFNNMCEQLNGKARSIINAQPIGGADDNERKLVYKHHSGIFMRMLYNMIVNPVRAMLFGIGDDYDIVKHNYKINSDKRYADAFDHFKSRNYFASREESIKQFIEAGKRRKLEKDNEDGDWDGDIPSSMFFVGNQFIEMAVNDADYFGINPYAALRFFGIGKTQYINYRAVKIMASSFENLIAFIGKTQNELYGSQKIIIDDAKDLCVSLEEEAAKEYFIKDYGEKPFCPIDIACNENAHIFKMTGNTRFYVLYMMNVFKKKGKNGREDRRLTKTFKTIRFYAEDDITVKDDVIIVNHAIEVNYKDKSTSKIDPENEKLGSFKFDLGNNVDYCVKEFVIKHFDDTYDNNDAFRIEAIQNCDDEKLVDDEEEAPAEAEVE